MRKAIRVASISAFGLVVGFLGCGSGPEPSTGPSHATTAFVGSVSATSVTGDNGDIDTTLTSEGTQLASMRWSRATGVATWDMPKIAVEGSLDPDKTRSMTPEIANGALYGVFQAARSAAHAPAEDAIPYASTCFEGGSASCCLGNAPAGCGCSSSFICCCSNHGCQCQVLSTNCSGGSCA